MASKGIRRLVEIALKKGSARKVERELKKTLDDGTDPRKAKRNLRVVQNGLASLKKAALGLGVAIAGALSVRALFRFGKEAVRVAGEAQSIWNRLAQSIENTGKKFEDLKPQIDAIARSMQDATTVGDEDFARILTELINITGNYGASLGDVETVANLAAAKQMDLVQAAQVVGRTMLGESTHLKRYGIEVQAGANAIEVLRDRFRGFAEVEAKSFQGRLKQLSNEWGDFKQAVGEAILEAGNGTSVLETLIGVVKTLTEWVNSNHETFTLLGETLKSLGSPLLTLIELYARLTQGASMLAKAQNVLFRLFPGGALDRVADRMEQRIETMDAWARSVLALVERLRAGEPTTTLPPRVRPPFVNLPGQPGGAAGAGGTTEVARQPVWPGQGIPSSALSFRKQPGRGFLTDPSRTLFPGAGSMFSGFESGFETARATFSFEAKRGLEELSEQIEALPDTAREASAAMQMALTTAAYTITDAFAEGFELVARDMSSLPEAAKGIGLGIVRGLSQGMAQYHMSQGIGKLAEGLWPINPAALASSAKHFLAAAAFKALGALTGGGGGSSSSAGSNLGGATAAKESERGGPEVHIYLDPFDPNNPLHQRQVKRANDLARERYGEQVPVTIHARGGA